MYVPFDNEIILQKGPEQESHQMLLCIEVHLPYPDALKLTGVFFLSTTLSL